jgi:predicted RND superfamily exporter protein
MRRRGIVVGVLLFVGASLFAFLRLEVESDPLKFLPKDSDAVVAYDEVSQRLTGYYALEVVVELPTGWLTKELWPVLEGIAERLSTVEGVARVVSPLDFLKKFNHWEEDFDPEAYVLPQDEASALALIEPLSEEDLIELGRLVAGVAESDALSASKTVRLSALVQVIDSTRFLRIVEAAEMEIDALPEGYSGYATGMVVRLVQGQLHLVRTQLESFSLAFLMVFVCMLVGLRSWKLLLVSVLPNMLPILCAFAAMALWGVALNAATVMVASVCLGIAVDDTVHMLSAYARERRYGRDCDAALSGALKKVGPAMAITTATACIGFFSLYQSQFVPITYFGLLAGMAMIVALLADVILAPALLAILERERGLTRS